MYEPLKTVLGSVRKRGVSKNVVLERLTDAALETTVLRPTEEFGVKLALFLSTAEDLVDARVLNRQDLCELADDISARKVKYGKSLDVRLAASLRRMAICP